MKWLCKSFLLTALVLMAIVAQAAEPQSREWSDATGQFKINAAFVEFKNGNVVLRTGDDKTFAVPVAKLSAADQKFVREMLANQAVAAQAQPADSRGDWPHWRGPNDNSVADGPAPPTSWDETQNVVWKTPVPGRGHSSPTVFGDFLYLATADEQAQTQSVVCFDRNTGKQLWQTIVGRGGFPKIHNKNTHASQTVACDGERLFITFLGNDRIDLTALSLDGKQLWQKTVGPFQPKAYKYGYSASPLIYKETVIVVGDCDTGSFLTAFNRRSGEVVWQGKRPATLSWSSPIVATIAGRDQLLLSGGGMVSSYDPATGRGLWQTEATTAATAGTMVWEGDYVFASGGYPKAETVCVKADGSGRVVWSNNAKCYEQSLLVHDGYLYAVTDPGVAYCWKASDGQEMWKTRLQGPISSSPVLAGGNIYAADERGTMFVFRADPSKFELVAQNQLGDEMFATPTICDGQIFLRVAQSGAGGRRETLYCIGSGS
ncbi:outer membrane protein assembly factor BamB family protein [Lignipirellula cremea]|uniref:Outer membrane biogenesis protein BamB n=1 Tax=Lignipirellula cremea TaxID=2528010 RepID=A0A518DLZ7_9BACT|nr:PQQ-binding-like beta-propeller repeat protein [Lignipirellula cremea]QDU92868.1 outer membrane biogenesis protein BamB [Lignipirellula cremea]